MGVLVDIFLALVFCFAVIRVAAIISIIILIKDDCINVEQAESLYKEFVKLEYSKRKDEDKWGASVSERSP